MSTSEKETSPTPVAAVAAQAFFEGGDPVAAVIESKKNPSPAIEVTEISGAIGTMPTDGSQTPLAKAAKAKPEPEPEPEEEVDPYDNLQEQKAILEAAIAFEEKSGPAYEQALKDAGLTRAMAMRVIDAVFLGGHRYTERFVLYSKLAVTFRTRMVEDFDRINIAIDKAQAQHGLALSMEHWRASLACSIVRYGNVEFDDDFDARVKWVNGLTEPVYRLLTKKLQEFDKKTEAIFSDGFLENF